ncbi:hypothetical protein [Clostridium botulinum]|uniref:hypothetical protein n=1 Tax=Clostridium botulinum TaxID=1491 RepID=UPI000A6F14CF
MYSFVIIPNLKFLGDYHAVTIESIPIKEYNISNLLTIVEANMDYLTTNEMSEIWEIS